MRQVRSPISIVQRLLRAVDRRLLGKYSPGISQCRSRYLDLMQACLTNSIYQDPAIMSPAGKVFNEQIRLLGKDWPSVAHTMIGTKRMDNLRRLCETVIRNHVAGDFIETGVWRGGACIYMKSILEAYGDEARTVWVADSFEGLPEPDPEKYPQDQGDDFHVYEELAISLEEVQDNFRTYGLLDEKVRFLKGWFKDTLHKAPIDKLAILRLDGDMYESTMDALQALYPKLQPGGYVIVDDYHVVDGCKAAVHDYRRQYGIEDGICEIDGTGVYWMKSGDDCQCQIVQWDEFSQACTGNKAVSRYADSLPDYATVYVPAVFLHMQKCAGTSMVSGLLQHYLWGYSTHGDFVGRPVSDFSNNLLLSGHFGYDYIESFVGERYVFTMMRDPVERVLSFYYYCRSQDPAKYITNELAHKHDLLGFLGLIDSDEIIHAHLWNYQASQLAGGAFPGEAGNVHAAGLSAEAIESLALEHLDKIAFAGVSESYEACRQRIFSDLNITIQPSEEKKNVTVRRPMSADLSDDEMEALMAVTRVDRAVYERVSEGLREQGIIRDV